MAFYLVICYMGSKFGEVSLSFSHLKMPLPMKLFQKRPPVPPFFAHVVMVRGSEAPVRTAERELVTL